MVNKCSLTTFASFSNSMTHGGLRPSPNYSYPECVFEIGHLLLPILYFSVKYSWHFILVWHNSLIFNGSGCVAGWPAMQPRGLRSRPAGYAAYPSAFGCIAGLLWMCIVHVILRKKIIGNLGSFLYSCKQVENCTNHVRKLSKEGGVRFGSAMLSLSGRA